jgi:hypothetical protein
MDPVLIEKIRTNSNSEDNEDYNKNTFHLVSRRVTADLSEGKQKINCLVS